LQKVALALAFLSVSILSFSYFSEVLWSMFVAFFYAVYMIFQKWTSALNKLNVLFCHISIVLLSLFLLFDISIIYIPQEISFWKNIGSIVFIFTLLPLYLNLYANQYIPSSTLGILIYINPLVAFLLSIFLF
jgi:chloramphenicol-sensitive protein RarD